MKDVSDNIIGCVGDTENKMLPVLPSLEKVYLEEKPILSDTRCERCDTSRALPEFSNTWGDFEGFDEFTPQSEQFYYADEVLKLNSDTNSTINGEHCTEQIQVQDRWDAFNEDDEPSQNCEHIFRLCFPAGFEEDTSEEVKSLDAHLASTSKEENVVSQLLKSHFWPDCEQSENVRDILTGNPGCDWKNLKGCRDLMSLLCISAENTSFNRNPNAEVLPNPNVEQLQADDILYPIAKKSLIQTKLEVTPGSKQGHIISYQLFLKKPSADVSFLNFSGKKSFFSTNQMRFNF